MATARPHAATILVVEDDVLLRMDAVLSLEDAGFRVVEAGNAEEAILILENRLDITVVFTDVDMPGSMNGIKLAEAVRGRWPPIKIIATSGHHVLTDDDFPSGSRFFPKPYNFDHITHAIRKMVD